MCHPSPDTSNYEINVEIVDEDVASTDRNPPRNDQVSFRGGFCAAMNGLIARSRGYEQNVT